MLVTAIFLPAEERVATIRRCFFKKITIKIYNNKNRRIVEFSLLSATVEIFSKKIYITNLNEIDRVQVNSKIRSFSELFASVSIWGCGGNRYEKAF